jgi:hypothetical protein
MGKTQNRKVYKHNIDLIKYSEDGERKRCILCAEEKESHEISSKTSYCKPCWADYMRCKRNGTLDMLKEQYAPKWEVLREKYKDVKKLVDSNIFLGNILLENLSFMKVKKFINFSTVWQDPNPKKDNFQNLYAAYKSSFSTIVKFYKKILTKIDFFEIVLSDTYGLGDNRDKLINTIKKNFEANRVTKIISKNLYINYLGIGENQQRFSRN